MVLLIQLVPWVVLTILGVIILCSKHKKVRIWAMIALIIFLIVYPKVQPSYMPKGEISRTAVPGFEPSKAVIEDNNRKPVSSEERQAKQDEEYRLGAPGLRPDNSGLGIKP